MSSLNDLKSSYCKHCNDITKTIYTTCSIILCNTCNKDKSVKIEATLRKEFE